LAADGLPVVVTGPAAERDLVAAVAARTRGVVALAGAFDVPDLAALLAGAAVAVTNNSGGMHLADAVGTPVVALFAGTEDEGQYRPARCRPRCCACRRRAARAGSSVPVRPGVPRGGARGRGPRGPASGR
jgi:ADP-heptose:LPS heptosyltransferase